MIPDDDMPLTPALARQKSQNGLLDTLAGNEPRPIVLRLKRIRKVSEMYALKLTQPQREALLHFTRLNRDLKHRIEQAGEGTQVVPVTENELRKLYDQAGKAAAQAPSADQQRLNAVMRRVSDFFDVDDAEFFGPKPAKGSKRRPSKTDRLFQFKLTLQKIQPAIWRRIQVPDCTLVDFHEFIQAAFGWENCHLHQFEIDGVQYSQPAPDGDDFEMDFEDETEVLLSKLLLKASRKARWVYEYDFGDGWRHEVLFEGFPTNDSKAKYPLCLEGERACPPEDCGGSWAYADYLAAIADPQRERHAELLAWRGPFDPEAFDAKKATKEMRKVKS